MTLETGVNGDVSDDDEPGDDVFVTMNVSEDEHVNEGGGDVGAADDDDETSGRGRLMSMIGGLLNFSRRT